MSILDKIRSWVRDFFTPEIEYTVCDCLRGWHSILARGGAAAGLNGFSYLHARGWLLCSINSDILGCRRQLDSFNFQIFTCKRLTASIQTAFTWDIFPQEARLSDSGNIKCVATNILGRATSIGQLIIEGTSIPQYFNIPIPQYQNTSVSQYLNTSIPQYQIPQEINTQISQYLNTSRPYHSSRYLNS